MRSEVARQATELLLGAFGVAVERNTGAKRAKHRAMRRQEMNLGADWVHASLLLLSFTLGVSVTTQ